MIVAKERGRAPDPVGRASDPVGRVLELAGRAFKSQLEGPQI